MHKIYVRFFTIADFEEEEAWLRRQHRAGLRLIKTVIPCFYIFEQCTPEDVVYRLDYTNYAQDEEYMQMFRDYGWEYFNDCMGWLYFRKPAAQIQSADESELFSDAISKVGMLQHVFRTRMLPILIIFFCCLLPNFVLIACRKPNTSGFNLFALVIVPLLVCFFLIFHCGLKLRRLKQRYKPK